MTREEAEKIVRGCSRNSRTMEVAALVAALLAAVEAEREACAKLVDEGCFIVNPPPCPHCGYRLPLPNGRCGLCIPPEFRAETAAKLMAAHAQAGFQLDYERHVRDADALIAALGAEKPEAKP